MKNRITYFSFIAILFSILAVISCRKEDNNTKDEYFIRYQFEKSSNVGKIYNMVINYTGENGNSIQTETKSDFETTIGPVKKGFISSINVIDKNASSTEYNLKIKLKIFVSKNNGPFAEKAINDKSTPRSSASLIYEVN
jgi:hypothetical protein